MKISNESFCYYLYESEFSEKYLQVNYIQSKFIFFVRKMFVEILETILFCKY